MLLEAAIIFLPYETLAILKEFQRVYKILELLISYNTLLIFHSNCLFFIWKRCQIYYFDK